jgi:ElaB/YqjD/DUF883 family membrane-anchored ribosome-binding protein
MPTSNQGKPQGRQNGGSGPSSQGARDAARDMGQRLQEGAQQLGDRAREGLDTASEHLGRNYRRAEGAVARHPSESVLIGFGLGVGLGVLLAVALTQREETWAERYLPDSLRDVQGSLGELPDALRDLPDQISATISRYWPRSMRGR